MLTEPAKITIRHQPVADCPSPQHALHLYVTGQLAAHLYEPEPLNCKGIPVLTCLLYRPA